jgi:hypothetical protein
MTADAFRKTAAAVVCKSSLYDWHLCLDVQSKSDELTHRIDSSRHNSAPVVTVYLGIKNVYMHLTRDSLATPSFTKYDSSVR